MLTKSSFFYGLVILMSLAGGWPSRLVNKSQAPSTAPTPLFKFVVYGDTRTNDGVHREIVTAALETSPDFILQTGDLVQFSGFKSQWDRFDQITRPIRDLHIPYYPTRGNHDAAGGARYLSEVKDKFDSGNLLYYRFSRGNLRFIALDTESALYDTTSAQYAWLESELQLAQKENKIAIPFFHEAIFTVGTHAGENRKLRSVLHPLFRKYGVKLVFQGHDHLYYRTQRDDITYIVTGGGGAPLYPINESLLENGDVALKLHHFCLAQVFADRIDISVYAMNSESAGMHVVDQFSVALAGRHE